MDDLEKTKVKDFWDKVYSGSEIPNSFEEIKSNLDFVYPYLGHLNGKKVLDLGCGNGHLSLLLASHGALVTAVDMSENAVKATLKLVDCKKELIKNQGGSVSAFCMDALDIDRFSDTPFDFVFGKFILHHIEPFDVFVKKLSSVVKSGGRLVFYENSSNNSLLMFFRTHLVGHFGIPKYSDGIEVPLMESEITELRKYFIVKIIIPKLVFFRLIGEYIFPNNRQLFIELDNFCFRVFPVIKHWSYHQLLVMKKVIDKEDKKEN